MGGREAPPHFVDEAVFAYYFSLFLVIFGNILKKKLKKMVGNEGFGYEVAMKGGYERWLKVATIFH